MQRVVAVQVKGGDGMEDFGAADAVLPCQYPLVGDDFAVDGVMVEGLQLLPVLQLITFRSMSILMLR